MTSPLSDQELAAYAKLPVSQPRMLKTSSTSRRPRLAPNCHRTRHSQSSCGNKNCELSRLVYRINNWRGIWSGRNKRQFHLRPSVGRGKDWSRQSLPTLHPRPDAPANRARRTSIPMEVKSLSSPGLAKPWPALPSAQPPPPPPLMPALRLRASRFASSVSTRITYFARSSPRADTSSVAPV